MAKSISFAAALAVLATMVNSAFLPACDCVGPKNAKAARDAAAAVFTGRVVQLTEKPNFMHEVVFKVDRQWKGITSEKVIVLTAANGGACGYTFQLGQSYLVFCHAEEKSKSLHTDICTRNANVKEARADIEELGPVQALPAAKP